MAEDREIEIPIDYARRIVAVADALKIAMNGNVYNEPFDVSKIEFWDGMTGEKSEYSLSNHDDALWIVYTPIS